MKPDNVSSDVATFGRNRVLFATAALLELGWIALLVFLAIVR